MNRKFLIILFTFLSICVLLGDTNQSVVLVLCGGGILGLYIQDWFTSKTIFTIEKKLAIGWLTCFFVMLISSSQSLSLGFSISNIIKYICALLLYVYFSNKAPQNNITEFLQMCFYWVLIILLISYIYSVVPYLQQRIPLMNLLYMAYGHNHIVDLLFFVIPYAWYMLVTKKSLQIFLWVVFLFLGVLTSRSSGAIIILCLVGVVYLWKFLLKKKLISYLTSLCVIVCGSLLFSFIEVHNAKNYQVDRVISYHTKAIFENRIPYWEQSIQSVLSNPLLGHGPGTFALISKKYQHSPNSFSWYAHSYPLQTLAEIGVIGALIVGFLIYSTVRIVESNFRHSQGMDYPKSTAYIGIILILLYSFVEINLDFSVVWMLFWIFLGLLGSNRSFSKKSTHSYVNAHISGFLILLFLYISSFLIGTYFSRINKLTQAVIFMPYNASIAETYLSSKDQTHKLSDFLKTYIYHFHSYNSDVLSLLAVTERDTDIYNDLMIKAIKSDPQNRSLLEKYSIRALSENRKQDLKFIVDTMISSLSIDNYRDKRFLRDRWDDIKDCFNSNTLIWNDSPFVDTYQAKSLYFAALCLMNKNDISNAKELLRIASDSRPSWSYIYVDYAAIVWWNDTDYVGAMRIIKLCKENIHAKKHCSDFDNGTFLRTSVYDPSITLKK